MLIKVYKASNSLTVPVVRDGKVLRYVVFRDENYSYRTCDEVEQSALEALPLFGSVFKLVQTIDLRPKVEEDDKGYKGFSGLKGFKDGDGLDTTHMLGEEHEMGDDDGEAGAGGGLDEGGVVPTESPTNDRKVYETADWQEAKEILRKEYGIAHQSLNHPANILKKADEAMVVFPNLKL